MDDLTHQKILIIDCQTTGMHPNTASLLQIAWCVFDARSEEIPLIEKKTLRVEAHELSNKIIKMLNITEEELAHSVEPKMVFDQLQGILKGLGPKPIVLAHYAQFEQSFLKHFYL
jgi:DNA polymerase-3 subunit epsilon